MNFFKALFKKKSPAKIVGCDVYNGGDFLLIIPCVEADTGALVSTPEVVKLNKGFHLNELKSALAQCVQARVKVKMSDADMYSRGIFSKIPFKSWNQLFKSTTSCHIQLKNKTLYIHSYRIEYVGRNACLVQDGEEVQLRSDELETAGQVILKLVKWHL